MIVVTLLSVNVFKSINGINVLSFRNVTVLNCVQPMNKYGPKLFIVIGILNELNNTHPLKALSPMDARPFGNIKFDKSEQLLNVLEPILLRELGNVIDDNFVHDWNATSPILVIPSPIDTLVKAVQF